MFTNKFMVSDIQCPATFLNNVNIPEKKEDKTSLLDQWKRRHLRTAKKEFRQIQMNKALCIVQHQEKSVLDWSDET